MKGSSGKRGEKFGSTKLVLAEFGQPEELFVVLFFWVWGDDEDHAFLEREGGSVVV